MDGTSIEHNSDSDSGESWTLLENTSVYADEVPEFLVEKIKHETQPHEKDEDTDGISIISDSDHEASSLQPSDHTIFEKRRLDGNVQSEKDTPEYIPVIPNLPINENNQGPEQTEDFLGDTHAKHKTYVHRRNKRLSTVLNIIVLGSVITAAGVAIGHMWGAKNDCTMQATYSVNKILSNLYKLQEENAYLRSKLKEFTFYNNNQIQQHKIQSKHNKCRRVFEESLSNNEPRKITKCVDENLNKFGNFMDMAKPKHEKEFVADIDKLKTVYLQNKGWLDDEITRRMKMEEELLKKYNNEVNSPKEKKDPLGQKKDVKINSDGKDPKVESLNVFVDKSQKKVLYDDSLQTDHIRGFRREDKRYAKYNDNDWLNSKHNINNNANINNDYISNVQSKHDHKTYSEHKDYSKTEYVTDSLESEDNNNNRNDRYVINDNWTEVKPKFQRYEAHETGHESFLELKRKSNNKEQQKVTAYKTHKKPDFNGEHVSADNSNSNRAQEAKNKGKEKHSNSERNSHSWKNYSNEENFVNEENVVKDKRYVNNLKEEKKKNGYVNYNKKQKRKSKHEKWNTKGQRFEGVEASEDFVLNYPDKTNNKLDSISIVINIDNFDRVSGIYRNYDEKSAKIIGNMDKNNKKSDTEPETNWFEKRAVLRTEARKKYYEQFGETSPNNSSWYFRRMRKREQCRAKGDNNSTFRIHKEKKNHKTKH